MYAGLLCWWTISQCDVDVDDDNDDDDDTVFFI